jgi:endonuclease YncB( thermonuclease family)
MHDRLGLVIFAIALSTVLVIAKPVQSRQCCSRHGGIALCDEQTGMYRCSDGYLSQCPCKPAQGFRWRGRLTGAEDCRSLEFDRDGRAQVVRLYGIICVARNERISREVIRFVKYFAAEKLLNVDPVATDRQGRESAWVGTKETNLNLELVKKGLAYWDRTQAPMNTDLKQAEGQARAKHLGVWSETNNPFTPGP